MRITEMLGIVATAVAEIDPTDEGNVRLGPVPSHEDEFLMVRAGPADAGIQQHLTSCLVHCAGQIALLRLVEAERLGVRSP